MRLPPGEREELLLADPEKFFALPHDANGPWMRLRLEAIEEDELLEVLRDAWRGVAPKRVLAEHPDV